MNSYHSQLQTIEERNMYSLFLHVPLFEVIPREGQVQQLAQLLKNLSDCILKQHK